MSDFDRKELGYNCFWQLQENYSWALRGLDIEIVKVNPETGIIDDDECKNTKVEYWLETGQFDETEQAYTHDIRLDCGADSFEEALCELLVLVKKYYAKETD